MGFAVIRKSVRSSGPRNHLLSPDGSRCPECTPNYPLHQFDHVRIQRCNYCVWGSSGCGTGPCYCHASQQLPTIGRRGSALWYVRRSHYCCFSSCYAKQRPAALEASKNSKKLQQQLVHWVQCRLHPAEGTDEALGGLSARWTTSESVLLYHDCLTPDDCQVIGSSMLCINLYSGRGRS
jgi:hypothetical protein